MKIQKTDGVITCNCNSTQFSHPYISFMMPLSMEGIYKWVCVRCTRCNQEFKIKRIQKVRECMIDHNEEDQRIFTIQDMKDFIDTSTDI